MPGGTECEASRSIGPTGVAVTGTSIAEAGLPSLKMSKPLLSFFVYRAVTGVWLCRNGTAVRLGERASCGWVIGMVSLGSRLRLLCGSCVGPGGESGGNIS